MEETKMLEILNRIKVCIERDSLMIAKDLVRLEINNLKGITEKNKKDTKYYCHGWACKYCNNSDCKAKQNKH